MTTTLVDVDGWWRWRTSRSGAQHWRRWALDEPALDGWSTADLASPQAAARTDAMQAALVGLAQDGEGEAATTLLVQLRPGLHRIARWAAAAGGLSWPDAIDEVRAVFFETVYRHRLDRRPVKIAANLILDTRQRVQRGAIAVTGRPVAVGGDPVEPSQPGRDPLAGLLVADVLQAGLDRLGGSDQSKRLTASIAFRAWVLDQARGEIAADLGVAQETVTTRLHRLRSIMPRDQLAA